MQLGYPALANYRSQQNRKTERIPQQIELLTQSTANDGPVVFRLSVSRDLAFSWRKRYQNEVPDVNGKF
jgi:hypothetical protein